MAKIVTVNGEVIETHDDPRTLKELQTIVGGLIEFVYLSEEGDQALMVVNESGMYTCPQNVLASLVAGQPIFGDVIIGPHAIGGD